ncbi:unnamed protein product [marine sediment metagenome]|uniref:Uncharacterized protein n=1 Tax=marine sediment metagenome TaxID=412755 RepID=X1RLZ8_9ZZZZ
MGRKKIPNAARRQIITVSLKPATINRIEEAIPKRLNRSKWIEQAIDLKLDAIEFENPQRFANKRLLAMIHGRLTTCLNGGQPIEIADWNMDADMSFLLEQISILHGQYLGEKK